MATEADKLALHFKYCALIFALLLVAVATDRWTAQKDFTAYLSNAATMTSLVLGLVAIFYSFISNDSLSRSLGSIATISSDVRSAREQIGEYLEVSQATADTNATNTALIQTASKDLTHNLVSLQGTLKSIAEQNQTLQGLVSGLPTRIDQLETRVVDVAKSLGEKPSQPQTVASQADISSRAIERFLARASLSQNLFTYACVLAHGSKKELFVEQFCKAIDVDLVNTLNGFLHGMHAMQLISRKLVDGKNKVYLISAVHPDIDSQTKSYFIQYIEDNYVVKSVERDQWLTKMKNVEVLFA